ncbi:unnamed protein product [Brassica oleracea]
MGKRKTDDPTATEWNKRHRQNTLLRSDTSSMIPSSSGENSNRKATIIPSDTQRRAREMRRAILLSKKSIRKHPTFTSFVFNFLNMEITDSPTLFKYEMTNHPY